MKELSEYDKQAADFLAKYGLKLRITLSDSKPVPWGDDEPRCRHHYRVTLSKQGKRITFDFWGSEAYAAQGKDPSAYDVLACISGDVYCPETFEEFCSEYGYDNDSIKAKQTFNRADRFARRLRDFFTQEEIESLSEIR